MAIVKVAVEMVVPSKHLAGDDTKLNQFAGTALDKYGFVVDYLKMPRILKRNPAKKSVVLFFGTADSKKIGKLKAHPLVLDVFEEDTDPDAYAQLLQKKN